MQVYDAILKHIRPNFVRTTTTNRVFCSGYKRAKKDRKPMSSERLNASRIAAARRAYKSIKDIIDSNVWEYFTTGTLDEKIVGDRLSYESVSLWAAKEIKRIRRKYSDAVLIVVPEKHKNGAWHFHALIAGCGGAERMAFSGRYDAKGRPIFNWKDWTLGFSTATLIDDSDKAGNYILKYITKDKSGVPPHKRRYWASRGADRTVVTTAHIGAAGQRALHDELSRHAETASVKAVSVQRDDGKDMQITYSEYRGLHE
jgi:hypothetical protein